MYRIEVAGLPPTLNEVISSKSVHQKRRWRDEWKGIMWGHILEAKLPKLIPPITLSVTQFCKSNVRDADNAVMSSKYFCDTLESMGLVDNDSIIKPLILDAKKGKENKQVFIIQT